MDSRTCPFLDRFPGFPFAFDVACRVRIRLVGQFHPDGRTNWALLDLFFATETRIVSERRDERSALTWRKTENPSLTDY